MDLKDRAAEDRNDRPDVYENFSTLMASPKAAFDSTGRRSELQSHSLRLTGICNTLISSFRTCKPRVIVLANARQKGISHQLCALTQAELDERSHGFLGFGQSQISLANDYGCMEPSQR